MIVITGPQRSGKTLHAAKFAERYECSGATLDWSRCGPSGPKPRDGDLVLTTELPEIVRRHFPRARIIPINVAREAVGLHPSLQGGFTL